MLTLAQVLEPDQAPTHAIYIAVVPENTWKNTFAPTLVPHGHAN